ncbi:hypothetical protein DL93DRAFT_2136807 [Clavulina sp. PMI_390]|nr:hypothetical protein DL93DRAFT_2136807 [Clavulina sp. PMI_390]
MGLVPPMPAVTALATYIHERNSSTCSMDISVELCQSVVLNSKWHDWYYADIMYAQPTVYFYCAGLAFFGIFYSLHLASKTGPYVRSIAGIPGYAKGLAITRSIALRQWRIGRDSGYLLPVGQIIIVSSMIIFFAAMTLGPKPYYWPIPGVFGYSPPIATRAGFMAIAILPFQVLFASKWNFITVVTGLSHEKLQVYHRWSGWIMFVLALIHTFPFIIVDIQMGMMEEMWRTDWYTVSGVMALIPQAGLVFLSYGPIRNRFYESFKFLHFLMAMFFIPILFLHCGFTLTSAYYFVGFVVAYTVALLIRWTRAVLYGTGHHAEMDLISDRMMVITIPTKLTWAPGQHFFIRFLTGDIHMFTSHPFSIASIPQADGANTMQILAKTHSGITANLANLISGQGKAMKVLLDGPYGGLGGEIGAYDHALLIGGGSGGTVVLSAFRHLVQLKGSNCKSISVVYSSRSNETSTWFLDEFGAQINPEAPKVSLDIHISTLISNLDDASSGSAEKLDLSIDSPTSSRSTLRPGRPDIPTAVQDTIQRVVGTLVVIVCGPNELTFDARNTVAREQMKIAAGEVACTECYLHTEAFGL